jgi:hypothetical protein
VGNSGRTVTVAPSGGWADGFERHLDRVGAGGGIRAGGDLPDLAVHEGVAAPQAHLHRRAGAHGDDLVLRDGEHDVARTIGGDADHGRAGAHHLAGFGLDRRDDARDIRHQVRITSLVALRRELRLGLLQLRLSRLQRRVAPFQFGAADEVLLAQGHVALVVGRRQVAVGACGSDLGPRGFGSQPVILRIELRQDGTCLHVLARLRRAVGDLSPHAEAQPRIHAGTDFTGELVTRLHAGSGHGDHLDRPDGFGRRVIAGAAEQQGERQQGHAPECRAEQIFSHHRESVNGCAFKEGDEVGVGRYR